MRLTDQIERSEAMSKVSNHLLQFRESAVFMQRYITRCLTVFIVLFSTYAYAYAEVDLNSKLWKLAKTKKFCKKNDFKNVNANIYNEDGLTPLMIAAQYYNDMFIDCMQQAKADVTLQDYNGKTAFEYIKKPQNQMEQIAASRTYNALRILEIHQIIGNKADIIKEEINPKKHYYKLYIEGAKCEVFSLPDDVICFSQKKKKRHGSKYSIYQDDIKRGVPPIFSAIQNHLHRELEQLLDTGSDVEMKYKGISPLFFALYQNDDRMVTIILSYGANPNIIDKNELYTPLSEACVINRISTVKLLLASGADVNYQYKKSETALTVAAKGCKNFELVKLLLENGADPEKIDRYGNTTFTSIEHYCRDKERYKKMKALIESYIK